MTGKPKYREMTIFLARHGEVNNPNHVLPGRLPNFHLSTHGKAQAKQAGLFLKERNIDVIYTSPMERCQETADIIRLQTGTSVPLFIHNGLTEIATARDGEPLASLEEDNYNFFTPTYINRGAESMTDIYIRARKTLQEIRRKHPGKTCVVVTHGDIIVFLKMKLLWNKLEFSLSRGPHYPPPCNILGLQFTKNGRLSRSTEINFYL
jgi:broad specificity phosphatase PhoE